MRFRIVAEKTYFWIQDMQHKRWNMPERATTINFGTEFRARSVMSAMNAEWTDFLRNPS